MGLNYQNCRRTECLHDAVCSDDIGHLMYLLHRPGIQLNCRNFSGDTPLLWSLRLKKNDAFVEKLIDAGCDVNVLNRTTALHLAMKRNTKNIATMLIKQGASVNAQDEYGRTPIHFAMQTLNPNTICGLLDAKVDLTITDSAGETPLVAVLRRSEDPEEDDGEFKTDCNRIYLAKRFIQENKTSVNYTFQGNSLLTLALDLNDVELYEIMWSKINDRILVKNRYPFLLAFLEKCSFPTYNWIECLYSLLASPVASELVKECEDYDNEKSLICTFLAAAKRNNLQFTNILKTISKCNNLGSGYVSCNVTVNFYTSNDDFDLSSYMESFHIDDILVETHSSLLRFVVGLEQQHELQPIITYYDNAINCVFCVDVTAIGYFSMPHQMKQKWVDVTQTSFPEYYKQHKDQIAKVPQVPSLLELSRNVVKSTINRTYHIENVQELQVIVEELELPKNLKEILLCRQPVYF